MKWKLRPNRKNVSTVLLVVLIVAFFLVFWSPFYESLVRLNPDPTVEYLRIMWILSPVGLSIVTIIIGAAALARAVFLEQ